MAALLILGIVLILLVTIFKFYRHFLGQRSTLGKKIHGPGIFETISSFIKMRQNIYILFSQWNQKYGPIFITYILNERFYIIGDVNLIKQALAKQETSGRPVMVSMDPLHKGPLGIINATGKASIERRTFALTTLKKFSLGRAGMGQLVANEMTQFLDNFNKNGPGELVWMSKQFFVPSMNALWMVVSNKRFTLEDDLEVIKMFQAMLEGLEELSTHPLVMNATLMHAMPWIPALRNYKMRYTKVTHYFEKVIHEHCATRIEGEPRDFIDAYIEANQNSFRPDLLTPILSDFLIAGSDTASVTMEWSILYLARNPKIQQKLRGDIHRIIGRDRLPTINDRSSVPSMEALILEVLRLSSPAPLGAPHWVTEDVQVDGYFIPKGSPLLTNLHWAHHDPKLWPEAEVFQPERFLDSQGNLDQKAIENVIPFATGRRRCIGSDLAMDTIFLFMTGLIQRFEFSAHPDYPLILDTAGGALLVPKNFAVVVNPVKGL